MVGEYQVLEEHRLSIFKEMTRVHSAEIVVNELPHGTTQKTHNINGYRNRIEGFFHITVVFLISMCTTWNSDQQTYCLFSSQM